MGGPVTSIVPGADDAGDILRPLEAEGGECFQRIGIVLLAGEDQIASLAGEFRFLLKQRGITPLHQPQHFFQLFRKSLGVVKAEHEGNALQFRFGIGQHMGLFIAHHLDAMLHLTQEPVGVGQAVARFCVDPFRLGQCGKRLLRCPHPERRHAAAGDELLRLGEELDLADAAAPEFDIMTLHRNRAMALMGVDLPLDGMNIGNRRVIEIFAEDERRQLAQEVLARLHVAGHRPRLDIGGAFPVLPPALVIKQRRFHGNGERRRAGVGPQPEIGAEDITIGGALLHDAHQTAHHASEILRRIIGIVHDAG
ncbi:hypothetical protein D3C71_1069890 [compost metagenome]